MGYEFLLLIQIIGGGMGVNISRPHLAKIVSQLGGLGTVSGVALERVMARILSMGDPGGDIRRALSHFPFQGIAKMVLDAYFIPTSSGPIKKPRAVPVYSVNPSRLLIASIITANYAFVWLAKEKHNKPISINYLEKIALPHVYAVTGAMLAEVDVITMGAGLPFDMPKVITALLDGQELEYPVPVEEQDGSRSKHIVRFNPKGFFDAELPRMKRPAFIPIISSLLLAKLCLETKNIPQGGIQGLVVETDTAGGHNAPPRGRPVYDNLGQPVYGPKDTVDYIKLAELLRPHGLPFWIGGSFASPEKLAWAKSQGAQGIQVGTAFALCEQSGMDPEIRRTVRRLGFLGKLMVRTDPIVSPTGFPFKVAQIPGTVSDPTIYSARCRICNQGALVVLHRRTDGSIGTRCSAEPVEDYLRKGGKVQDTKDVGCICNGLLITAGLSMPGDNEPAIVTIGDDARRITQTLMLMPNDSYTAGNVMDYLLGKRESN